MHVRFTRAVIASFDRIVKKAVNTVAIVLVILRGVDAALRGDRVRAAGAVLEAKNFHFVTEFRKTGGSGRTGEPGADNENFYTAFIGRVYQRHGGFVRRPFLVERAFGDPGIKCGHMDMNSESSC